MKTKRFLSWVLAVIMVLSCLAVLPMAVSAETAPVMDGVKDEVYTDAKMLEVTTAYDASGSGAAKKNTDGMNMKVYYTWDAEYVYVFMDVTDPSATTGPDYLYFVNNIDQNAGFIFQDPNGGYIQFNADGSAAAGGAVQPAEYKVNRTAGTNNRSYEVKYAIGSNATGGFRISPAATNGAYCVAYTGPFGQNAGAKQVLFETESTWYEQKLEKVETEDPLLDGVKDDRYADTKKATVSTMYTGDHGVLTDNNDGMSVTMWYAWDDAYNYVYAEVKDPNSVGNIDAFYIKNNLAEPTGGYIFQQAGGGYLQNVVGGNISSDGSMDSYKYVAETGVRKYEFKFQRDPAAEGFMINGCAMKPNSNVISSGKDINTTSLITVKYADETTWVQTFAPEGGEEPTPPDEPVVPPPTPSEDGLDAIKDERYSEDQCTTISIAYGGSGAGKIVNRHHIYTKLYYAWDDNFNYVYFEIHDPFMTQGLDILYYITNTNAAAGIMFQQDGGGYLQWDTATGALTAAADANGREIKSASYIGDGVRQYEVILPKTKDAIGMQLSPVAYRENGAYSVSYDTNYYMLPNKNITYENQAGHHKDSVMTDPDVMTDPARIEAVEAELAKLPADANTLTYENDYDLVAATIEAVKSIPSGWTIFIDEELYARYEVCKAKMDELEAAVRAAELAEVEALIDALPDEVDLSNLEDIEDIKFLIDNLGDIASKIDAGKMAKFNAACAKVDALQSPVKIDGKKDAAYEYDGYDLWPMEQGYRFSSSSDMWLTPTDSYASIYTMADDNYAYLYVEVYDCNGLATLPEGESWNPNLSSAYDTLTTYIDMDPANITTGTPYQDADQINDAMFYFNMLADGTLPLNALSAKAQFLTDPSNFVSFSNGTDTYGYEMRIPRVEGEESFKINLVFTDPGYDLGTGETGLQIALGREWAYNYVGYGEKYFDDFPTFMNYMEILEGIEALPAPNEVVDNSKLKKAKKLKDAIALLNEDQLAYITDEQVAYLDAVIAAMENVGTGGDVVYGDVDGDGEISAADALEVLKSVVGKVTLTEDQKVAADVTDDGEVSAADALDILKKVVGKIEKFAVEE